VSNHKDLEHNKRIVEQFSKQAIPFSEVPGHRDFMQLLIQMSGVSSSDNVLDVACGPGLVACEFSKVADHVTGIDITAKMIERARCLQEEKQLTNMGWCVHDILPLPYSDNDFSIVLTRYSFHHFLKPVEVLAEMIRVCRPGGRVLVADVALPSEKSATYDRLEKIRDPSHTHALTVPEFEALFAASGLGHIQRGSYKVELELEQQLKASFPDPGDEEKIREILRADLHEDKLGVGVHLQGNEIHYSVPIEVFVGRK